MSGGATKCSCDAPHVERVELSPIHILGPGTFWRAAKPGHYYLAGHGSHFYTEEDANEYAFGKGPRMTVTDFLLARIAEDEAAARACEIPSWEIDHNEQPPWVNGLCITAMDSTWDACIAVTDAEHVVRHDPARVLAECAAKRAIIADCRPGTLDDLDAGEDDQPAPVWVARALAAVYKDHPDYQQEWAV